MRDVVLFIAMSLDGYIADRQGGVDWLQGQDPTAETPDSYGEFIRDVDTVVMGWNTYHQVVTELSPGAWPYEGLESYVVTHREPPGRRGIYFTGRDPRELIEDLRARPGKRIWICGGGQLIRRLMETDSIDVYHLSVIPTVLGGGVPLFPPLAEPLPLTLRESRSGNGIVEMICSRR